MMCNFHFPPNAETARVTGQFRSGWQFGDATSVNDVLRGMVFNSIYDFYVFLQDSS